MMKKALDQTVRELKREVNKKFLKVPTIEQKTLDATSNEPWSTRGPLMAEIAQASCNYNDYQLIMSVLWKRIQDTGKNWRHVYKALIVLEYLVIYGSERVIDDVREHAYQISTLSDFLYTDSNGRDQGSNVRRKAQILVALVNDKKRLHEVRHKAQSYKAKVSLPPLSSSARFNDEGRNREDDNYTVRANVANPYRSKCQSVDGYSNDSFDDYDRHSTRTAAMASMQKASSPSGLEETSSSGTNQAPESAASESAQAHEKEVGSLDEFDPRGSVSAASTVESSGLELDIFGFSAVDYTESSVSMRVISTSIPDDDMLTNSGFGATFVASTTHAVPSEPYENPFGYPPSNAFLRMDFPSETSTSLSVSTAEIHLPVEKGMEAAQSHDFVNTLGGPIYAPDVVNTQQFLAEPHSYASEFSALNSSNDILDGILPWTGPVASVSFQETEPSGKSLFLSQQGLSAYSASHAQNSSETGSADLQIDQINPFEQPESSNHIAGLRNPFDFQTFQPAPPSEINTSQMNYAENISQISFRTDSHVAQINTLNQPGLLAPQTSQMASVPFHKAQIASKNYPASSPAAQQAISSNIQTSKLSSIPYSARPDLIISSFSNPQPSSKKFEPKSTIWADSISRGLVDLNISGHRTNPLADIGIDFNDINRKEKRNEGKSSQTPLSSSSMGKAMGAGSGLGRAATGMYAQPLNTTMEMNQPYMGMGMGANIGMTHPSSEMPRQSPACRGAYNPMNARGGYGQYHPYGHGGHG